MNIYTGISMYYHKHINFCGVLIFVVFVGGSPSTKIKPFSLIPDHTSFTMININGKHIPHCKFQDPHMRSQIQKHGVVEVLSSCG